VNSRQVAIVLAGVVLFLAGAFIGLTPVSAPIRTGTPVNAAPFLDPSQAFAHSPGHVLVAAGLVLLGLATAVGGAYLVRESRARR